MQAVITFPSLTYALAAQKALRAAAIEAELIRLDARETSNGCANGLSVNHAVLSACTALLERRNIRFGEIIESKRSRHD